MEIRKKPRIRILPFHILYHLHQVILPLLVAIEKRGEEGIRKRSIVP